MLRTFSSQMTTELLISCILIRYKRTRWFYTLMGFVYFEQLYIYCPNSFLNYFSEPFEIIRQGDWIFKEAGRNENLKLIIYGLNFFAADWKKKIFSAFDCLLRMQFIVAKENFFLALSIIYKCQPPIPYIHVQGFWWLQFDFSSPIFCRLLIVHHLNPLLLSHKT